MTARSQCSPARAHTLLLQQKHSLSRLSGDLAPSAFCVEARLRRPDKKFKFKGEEPELFSGDLPGLMRCSLGVASKSAACTTKTLLPAAPEGAVSLTLGAAVGPQPAVLRGA